MTAAPVEPLTDGELDEVRNDLANGGNCVIAWTVRGLLARLDAAEADGGADVPSAADIQCQIEDAIMHERSVIVEAIRRLKREPGITREAWTALAAVQSIVLHERIDLRADAQQPHGGPQTAPVAPLGVSGSCGTDAGGNAPLRASSDAASVALAENGAQDVTSATETDWVAPSASRTEATASEPPEADLSPRAAPSRPGELLTPDQWCARYRIRIHDPDGWRGRNGRAWTDRITLAEFQHRATRCTADQGGDGWERMAADLGERPS